MLMMKIYVLGSTAFMHSMVAARDELKKTGFDGWIHPDYDAYVSGNHPDLLRHKNLNKGEKAQIKRDRNYFKVHYENILISDAILIVNMNKKGIENYIGGNALIEMGQAYVNDKRIFLLNYLPKELPYIDEIEAMDPICLGGNIAKIKDYV